MRKQNFNILIKELVCNDYINFLTFLERNDKPQIVKFFNPFPFTSEVAQNICCSEHKDKYYAAFLERRIVGMSMLRGWDEGYVIPSFGIMVDNLHYGKGIGHLLTSYALDAAKVLGCKNIRLTVSLDNSTAIHLYKAFDFREVLQKDDSTEGDKTILMIKDLV